MAVTGDIFDLKKFALHDGPGIRTTVFFRGCPLSCPWCHNPEGLGAGNAAVRRRHAALDPALPPDRNVVGPAVEAETLIAELIKDEVFYRQSGGGVTMSGGEPFGQPAFLVELLEACRGAGLHTAVDTCGYAPWEDIERSLTLVDLFLFDVKLADAAAHRRYTGVSNVPVVENLGRLVAAGADVRARVPLVPGITDTPENLAGVRRLLVSVGGVSGVGLLPYNKLGEDKRRRLGLATETGLLETQDADRLEEIAGLFRTDGFDVTIGG